MMYNILTGRENSHLQNVDHFMIHKEAIHAFQELKALAKKELNIEIGIISSFRDYTRQLNGWNLKAQGKRPLFDDQDNQLEYASLSSEQILYAILKWSAVPGASRHHWGTDLDIYDATAMKKEEVHLLQSECAPDGPCGKLHLWLDELIKTNQSLGFFRPYDHDLGGVGVEKWHLSYAPIAQDYFNHYTLDIFIKNIQESDILLKELILEQAEFIFERYVKNITPLPF